MVYVLVDNYDNIVDRKDLSDIGINGAKTFFMGRKKIEKEEFDKLWSVMTYTYYKEQESAFTRKPSSEQSFRSYPGYIRWWEDEDGYLDMEK